MNVLRWRTEVREHRSWDDGPTELSDWYVFGRRLTLNWNRQKTWGFGVYRYGTDGVGADFGPLFLYFEFEVPE